MISVSSWMEANMTGSNWAELIVILITVIVLGIILIRVSKKVADIDGMDIIDADNDDKDAKVIISGR